MSALSATTGGRRTKPTAASPSALSKTTPGGVSRKPPPLLTPTKKKTRKKAKATAKTPFKVMTPAEKQEKRRQDKLARKKARMDAAAARIQAWARIVAEIPRLRKYVRVASQRDQRAKGSRAGAAASGGGATALMEATKMGMENGSGPVSGSSASSASSVPGQGGSLHGSVHGALLFAPVRDAAGAVRVMGVTAVVQTALKPGLSSSQDLDLYRFLIDQAEPERTMHPEWACDVCPRRNDLQLTLCSPCLAPRPPKAGSFSVWALRTTRGMYGRDKSGATALQRACEHGRLDLVTMLLARGSGPQLNSRDNRGYTPLMAAARAGHKDVVAALLAAEVEGGGASGGFGGGGSGSFGGGGGGRGGGAGGSFGGSGGGGGNGGGGGSWEVDKEATNHIERDTALMVVARHTPESCRAAIALRLIRDRDTQPKYTRCNACDRVDGATPLMMYAELGEVDVVRAMLEKKGTYDVRFDHGQFKTMSEAQLMKDALSYDLVQRSHLLRIEDSRTSLKCLCYLFVLITNWESEDP